MERVTADRGPFCSMSKHLLRVDIDRLVRPELGASLPREPLSPGWHIPIMLTA